MNLSKMDQLGILYEAMRCDFIEIDVRYVV